MTVVYDSLDMPDQALTFGKRLRETRHRARLSVAELARAAVLTENAIYRLESGSRNQPRADTIEALARALDVSADELLGLDPRHESLTEVPLGDLVEVPFAAGTDQEGDVILVPEICLPDDVPHDRLAAAYAPDDACAPDLHETDLAIIALDHPWSDGDLLALLNSHVLLIRRAYREGDAVLIVGADLTDRRTVPADSVIGRVMRSIRSH